MLPNMKVYTLCVITIVIHHLKPTNSSKNEETLSSEEERTNSSNSENQSTGKVKKKYFNYDRCSPHLVEITGEKKRSIMLKEQQMLKNEIVLEWEDIYKYASDEHQQFWDNKCVSMWPGIPGQTHSKYCRAHRLPLYRKFGSHADKRCHKFTAYRHDYSDNNETKVLPFYADFLGCDCKYVLARDKSHVETRYRRAKSPRKYFFAAKISDTEFFLLTRVQSSSNSGFKLNIVDYVVLPGNET